MDIFSRGGGPLKENKNHNQRDCNFLNDISINNGTIETLVWSKM